MKQLRVLLLMTGVLVISFPAGAQIQDYIFNGNLNGTYAAVPPLVENLACGAATGTYVTEPIITTAGTCFTNSTVFAFNASDGLQYNNAGFISNTYTIHLFFKYNTFGGGYARVIDFKNSCCDAGMYVLGNCLNFYPNGNVGTCPYFVDGNYYLISLVRDGASNQIKIYVNGAVFSVYNDASNTYASAGGTTPILFFRDDNAVPCEARAGHIRYLSLSPQLSTDNDVLSTWNTICTAILPINFKSFNVGRINQSDIALNWQTDNEMNNSHFDIERSSDGANFFTVGKIASQNGQGTNNYNFIDRFAMDGTNYYRLKEVDLDGRFVYSIVQKVFIGNSGRTVQVIYHDGPWLSTSSAWLNSSAILLSANSQVMERFEIYQSMMPINMQRYPAGVYFIQVQKNNDIITRKIIKY